MSKWHNLKKKPKDLPVAEKEVQVVCERRFPDKVYVIQTNAIYEDGHILENDSIWCWHDIEYGDYNEEEDCYYIPEGWYEYHHYQCDDDCNAIDDFVVAWREIEPIDWSKEE